MQRRKFRVTKKTLNLRYTLMKCDRKKNSSVKKIPHRKHYNYSTRESLLTKFNTDLSFNQKAPRAKIEEYRSRTLGFSLASSNRRSTKRVRRNKENN